MCVWTAAWYYPVLILLGDIVLYLTRCSFLVGNILVLVLMWIKTFKQWCEARQVNIHVSITSLFICDGKMSLPLHNKAQLKVLLSGTLYFMWVCFSEAKQTRSCSFLLLTEHFLLSTWCRFLCSIQTVCIGRINLQMTDSYSIFIDC
jgi:hypothetical protein